MEEAKETSPRFIKRMIYMSKELMEILGKQYIPTRRELKALNQIRGSETDLLMIMINTFNYGIMKGIRKERIRRSSKK